MIAAGRYGRDLGTLRGAVTSRRSLRLGPNAALTLRFALDAPMVRATLARSVTLTNRVRCTVLAVAICSVALASPAVAQLRLELGATIGRYSPLGSFQPASVYSTDPTNPGIYRARRPNIRAVWQASEFRRRVRTRFRDSDQRWAERRPGSHVDDLRPQHLRHDAERCESFGTRQAVGFAAPHRVELQLALVVRLAACAADEKRRTSWRRESGVSEPIHSTSAQK